MTVALTDLPMSVVKDEAQTANPYLVVDVYGNVRHRFARADEAWHYVDAQNNRLTGQEEQS